MPRVFIPPAMRHLTKGLEVTEVQGGTVGELIDHLDQQFPGIKSRLCANDAIRPGLSVVVGGSVSALGLLQRVHEDTEIHFLPALGGG